MLIKDLRAMMFVRLGSGPLRLVWTDFKVHNFQAHGIVDGVLIEADPYLEVETR